MTDTALQTIMDNKYPIKQFLLENGLHEFLRNLREARGYLRALYDFHAISETQYIEYLDFLADSIVEWRQTHV